VLFGSTRGTIFSEELRTNLIFMTIDPRVRRPLLPTRILWQRDAENAEILLSNDIGQARADVFPACTLKPGASVLLDFGRELHGSLQLVSGPTSGNGVAKLRLRFGESASEAMGGPSNDHALHDFEISLPPMGAQEYGMTAFRFARLNVLGDVEVPLVACRAMTLMRPLEAVGSFKCSDERLNQIWQVGADTVALCMQDFLWDGPKRDRLVWMGDLHPEIAVVSSVWGAHEIVPHSLDWVRDSTPLPQWMNGIGSYSMWWVIIQRDWFWHHGDRAYLDKQRAYLLGLLPLLIEQIGADGQIEWRGMQFLDWPSSDQPEAVRAGLAALVVMALRAGAQLCEVLGETAAQQKCRDALSRLEKAPVRVPENNKQACSLLALSGLQDARTINADVLARDPLHGLSTFYGFYVLQARALAGDFTGALDVIRRYWGAMLDLGATSFWEHFELDWAQGASRIDEIPRADQRDIHRDCGDHCYKSYRHSLCHGWAAGPTAWLSEHVLGIQILEAGARKIRLAPQLGDLEWAQGSLPTPHGPLRVWHQRAEGTIETHFEAPEGVEIVRGEHDRA